MAMVFSFPIILLIFVVYIFFPEWYTKISATSQGTFLTPCKVVHSSTFVMHSEIRKKYST